MAGLIARRTKRARHGDSGNGHGHHMFMPGHMQQQLMPGMMMPGYPYMNPGMMAMNNPMMNHMNPCAGIMSRNTPMTTMQAAPHGFGVMPGFSANSIPVDDDMETDDEEPDTAGVPEQQQQPQQGVGETPSSAASGSEVSRAPPLSPPVGALPLLPPPGSSVYNKGEDATITGSTSVLKGLPRTRLVQSLEKLHGDLEAGLTFCNCVSVVSQVCSEQLTSQKLQWVGGRVLVAAEPEGTPGARMDDDEAGAQRPHRPSSRLVRCSIGSQLNN